MWPLSFIFIYVTHFTSYAELRNSDEQASSRNEDSGMSWKDRQISQAGTQVFLSSNHITVDNPRKRVLDDVREEEQCDNAFIMKISHLLDRFNISLDYKYIENLRSSIKVKASNKSRQSGLYLAILINMLKVYPEFGNEESKRTFEADDLTYLENEPLFATNIGNHAIDSIKLVLTTYNIFHGNKSLIEIKMNVNFVQNYAVSGMKTAYFETETKSNFFGGKRKRLKVHKFSSSSILVGSFFGLLSSILCGLSFALKKWSFIKMAKNQNYYFDRRWWMGHSLMMIGDVFHFIAFYFAPAIIVCTLQILTVIVTAIASSKILGEKLHKYGKLAFALSLGGCWVIVFHVPNEPQIYSIDTLLYMLSSHVFLIYIAVLSIISTFLTSCCIPKYGKVNSLAYTFQCAIFGSIIVLGLKGVVLGYTDTLSHWLPWASFTVVTVFLMIQLEYLNKALSLYNTLVITTQYYVLYSAFVILASSLLLKVWTTSSQEVIFTNFCGLSTIALGALILTIFEEENATFDFSRLFAGPEIKKHF